MWLPKSMGVSYRTGTESLRGVRCYPGQSFGDIYVKVSSLGGTEWHKWLDVSCQWRCVPRGDTGADQGYGPWSEWYWGRFETASLRKAELPDGGGWMWSAPMSGMTLHYNEQTGNQDTVQSVLAQLTGGSVGFQTRKYDAIHLRLHSKFVFVDGRTDEWGNGQTAVMEQEVWISYVPYYQITGLRHTPRGLQVWYERTAGWDRPDDRWALNSLYDAQGRDLISYRAPLSGPQSSDGTVYIYGNVDGTGRATIPTDRLLRLPDLGERVTLGMRWNSVYNEIGFDWVSATATVAVDTTVKCNTPTVSARVADQELGIVEVSTGDSGDRGAPVEEVSLSVEGHPGAAVTVGVGEVARLGLVPLGMPVRIQAVGIRTVDETRVASGPASSGYVTIPSHGADGLPRSLLQDANDPTVGVAVRYSLARRPKETWSASRDQDSLSLSGRSRPSVSYGTVTQVEGSLEFAIVTEGRGRLRAQRREDVLALASAGPCVWRKADGTRKVVSVTSVDVAADEDVRGLETVRVAMREVDYGG